MSYNKGKTWQALKRAWRAYKIAKSKNDMVMMEKYAEVIRSLQRELGLEESDFSNLS
jgi:hypothetical protein